MPLARPLVLMFVFAAAVVLEACFSAPATSSDDTPYERPVAPPPVLCSSTTGPLDLLLADGGVFDASGLETFSCRVFSLCVETGADSGEWRCCNALSDGSTVTEPDGGMECE